jgi:hypothetical protein
MLEINEPFTVWLSTQPTQPGHLGFEAAVLKTGPQTCKTVRLSQYGDTETGEVRKEELRFATYPSLGPSLGYDFDHPTRQWACENDEIDRLLAFLYSDVAEPGRYQLIDTTSPIAAVVTMLQERMRYTAPDFVRALAEGGLLAEVLPILLSARGSQIVAEQAAIQRRRELLTEWQLLAATAGTTETRLQTALGSEYWVFGGRYTGVADRRNLVMLDQHDIPLLGADGTLHIVELKGPEIRSLVRRHRNHWIVGNDVHEAVSQTMNYLRSLDEVGATTATIYRNEFGFDYDMRRVFATVVIGHPAHVSGVEEKIIDQTIRSYNSHLSRVEVVTYKNLFDAAGRALEFEEGVLESDSRELEAEVDA